VAENPVILPLHGALHAGRPAAIEVVPPESARTCTARFSAQGRKARTYRVTLGGPSRTLRWHIGRSARGTWTATVSCGSGSDAVAPPTHTRTTFHVRRAGYAHGQLISGHVTVRRGWISDPPPLPTTARTASNQDVDTSSWKSCGSVWVKKAHAAGTGVTTRISMEPTAAARAIPISLTGAPGGADLVWDALQKCISFPPMTAPQWDSVYKQMVCHVIYNLFGGAGNTWDFEAWRSDASWPTALNKNNGCQNGGDVPDVASVVAGMLIHVDGEGRAAYLVDAQQGTYYERPITTTKAFGCLVAAGHYDLTNTPLPAAFVEEKLTRGSPVDDSICSSPGGGSGGGGSGGTVRLAQGPGASSGYRYAVSVTGFAPGATVSVTCYDSASPNGFSTFSMAADSTGSASTASQCFSGDGPDHWVRANGIESNHVSWSGGGGSAPPSPPPSTYAETTGGEAHTWTNYTNAGGYEGPVIPGNATVQIACAIEGFRVADGNTWWYQIAQSPWNSSYYVSADAFYNNGQTSGSLHGTPFVDPAVRHC
jgi:hypothetical protein